METKTLHTIQTLSKIGKVLSKIIEIFCIIGTIGCLIGIVTLAVGAFEAIKIGGITIYGIINSNADVTTGTAYVAMSIGLIFCICEGIIARLANKYFKNEIKAGTPFTLAGAKEMLRLGICTMAISVGALIVADITYLIMNKCFENVADMHLEGYNQVGIGLAFIIISLICKYGAERVKE